MSNVFGYCRISTLRQSIDRQVRNILESYPDAIIFQEAYTGTKISRPEWDKLLTKVKSGDTIVFDSVSRMSRNAEDGYKTYCELSDQGINLVFLKEHYIDTSVYQDATKGQIRVTIDTGDNATDELTNGMIDIINQYLSKLAKKQIYLAFEQAQKEVDDLRQRTKEGLKTVKIERKKEDPDFELGRRTGTKVVTKKSVKMKEKIEKYSKSFDGTLSDIDCIKLLGIANNTYYKYKKELKSERR